MQIINFGYNPYANFSPNLSENQLFKVVIITNLEQKQKSA